MITEDDDDKPVPWYEIPFLKELDEQATTGSSIRAFRLCEEWTLEEAAQRLGISKQALSAYERGLRLPTVENAMKIAEGLGMPPIVLIHHILRDQIRRAGLNYDVQLKEAG